MKTLSVFLLLTLGTGANAQNSKPLVTVERVLIPYQGKTVKARKLSLRSEISLPVDHVWSNLKTADLLVFVTKGYVKFKPLVGAFPREWSEGDTVATRTRLFGFIPFGGVRELFFETISEQDWMIQTRERDRRAKVWDHKIQLQRIDEHTTRYTEEIVIYGGRMTGLITAFAQRFYRQRQRRWQRIARENLRFF